MVSPHRLRHDKALHKGDKRKKIGSNIATEVEKNKVPAGAQNTIYLGKDLLRVQPMMKRQSAHEAIDRAVFERKLVGVAKPKLKLRRVLGILRRETYHFLGEIHAD
jgi:hypothetical protein